MARLDAPDPKWSDRYEAPISPEEREALRRAGATDEEIAALEEERLSRVRAGSARSGTQERPG